MWTTAQLQAREKEISLRKLCGGTAHAQTVWWNCACANCAVELRMRKLCGGTAHAQTVWWNCACANCVVELRICARWRGTLTLDII